MLFGCASRRTFFRLWMMKPLVFLLLIFVLMAIFLLCQIGRNYENYESFQQFSYPSNENFYKILESNNSNSFQKLFPYQPRVTIYPEATNETDIRIMIIVKSSIPNVDKRNRIRNSWASEICKSAHRLQVYFALGQNNVRDKTVQARIVEEAQKKKDIIQFDFVDKYHNNTFKLMSIMDYFVKFHSNESFLVIADDDYFVDPEVLVETITTDITKEQYSKFLGGYVWYQTKPERNVFSKWFVPKEKYRFEYYPPYPSGGFLLISSPMVKVLHRLLPYLKYNSIDDVLIGILMFKLKIYPTHLNNIYISRPNPFPKNVLACHTFSKDLQTFWTTNHYERKCISKDSQ